jgi:hypothetical protein
MAGGFTELAAAADKPWESETWSVDQKTSKPHGRYWMFFVLPHNPHTTWRHFGGREYDVARK